jgi:hypothetical protein
VEMDGSKGVAGLELSFGTGTEPSGRSGTVALSPGI